MAALRRAMLAALAMVAGGCALQPARTAHPAAPTVETYRRLADDVEGHLLSNVLPAWFPRCVDPAGGFYANFGRRWRRGRENPKSVVYQARQTWVAATIAVEHPKLAKTYLPIVRHGVHYLGAKLWDGEHGGFYWALPETFAEPMPDARQKLLYGNAFGIYALARAYRATRDESTVLLAVKAYRWWEQHAHDVAHGGYFESLTRDGRPILADPDRPVARRRSAIGTLYGYKSMNAHIHMLEALTELYGVWPDAQLRARLAEMLSVVRDRIAVEPGCLNQYFTPDWRPLPYGDSFGHDVETAFLLLEAAEALGEATDPRTLAVISNLVDHSLEYGWDTEHGGFFYEGTATSADHDRRKSWWVQAEGLHVLLLMHEHFGDETSRYWRAFVQQWRFIDEHMVDHRHGGWHATTTPDGRVLSDGKANVWKAAYHNVRALVATARRLRRLAAAPGRAPGG